MNFIYSFIEKPKHIFLVHGEEESQEVLKNKILEETQIDVVIPEFGETYELQNNEIKMTEKLVVEKPNKFKTEIKDMDTIIREDMKVDIKDEDAFRINEKIKDLEKQIIDIIS